MLCGSSSRCRGLVCMQCVIVVFPDHTHLLFNELFTEEEEVYLPRHRFVKARGHPPQTLQKYRIAFATSHKAPEQIHKLLF